MGLINALVDTQKTMSVCVDCVTSSSVTTHHELFLILLFLLHSSIPIRCVVDSVVTLLLQLDGEEAVIALHTMHGVCPPVCHCSRGEDGEWEDKLMI